MMEPSKLPYQHDYEYIPLKALEIRLLRIHPELKHNMVSCTLEHFTLSFKQVVLPEYSALSYTWGTDQAQFPVLMNGHRLKVNANLHAALQEFRTSSSWFIPETEYHDEHPYFIWIDALCINQLDLVERSEQVKLMRKVYQQASCLTVWLGLETSEVEVAAAAVKRLKSVQSTKQNDADILGEFKASDEEWTAIQVLLQNPYFSRSWVVQEYGLGGIIPFVDKGLANSVVFCCGSQRIYNLIEIGWKAASLRGYTGSAALRQPNPWAEIVNELQVLRYARNMYHNRLLREQASVSPDTSPLKFQTTFAALLLSQCRTLSSDPKDKVYSILGFAEELGGNVVKSYVANELIIDYTANPQEVFASSIRSIVAATGKLDVLGAAYKETSSLIKSSWTPDWTLTTTFPIYSLRNILYFRPDLDLDCTPGTRCDARFANDLSSLTVGGFILGEIIHVSSPPMSQFNSLAGVLKSRFRLVAELASGCGHTRTGDVWDRIAEILLLYLPTLSPSSHLFAAARVGWRAQLGDWILNMEEEELENKLIRKKTSALEEVVKTMDEDLKFNDDTLLLALILSASGTPAAGGESVIVSRNGHIGRSSIRVKKGDLLCVISGCALPMIFRPAKDHFQVISECFVPIVMKGESIEEWRAGEWTSRTFELH